MSEQKTTEANIAPPYVSPDEPDDYGVEGGDECYECGGAGGHSSCVEDCCPIVGGEDACDDPACWRRCQTCGGEGYL